MNLGYFLVLSGWGVGPLLASDIPSAPIRSTLASTPTPFITETPGVPIPVLLKDSDKMHDSESHSTPPPPGKSADGKSLQVQYSGRIPFGEAVKSLADSSLVPQIEAFNKSDNKSKVYYWHSITGLDFCHFRSVSGSQWYGWPSGGDFIWVLYLGGHFWWHDAYAERWLYFDRGYWRWQGPKKDQFQVYMENGHYYACSAGGILGDDLFTTGTEEDVTEPVVKETTVPLNKQEDETTTGGHGLDSFNHQYGH